MAKLLLLSVLYMTIMIPAYFARGKRPAGRVRRMVVAFAIFTACWIAFCACSFTSMLGPVDLDPLKAKKHE